VFVILFFLGVIALFYSLLFRQTREKIVTRGQLNAQISAQQIDSYLSTGIDTIKLVSYTLDNMIHAGKSNEEIHDYLVSESIAVKSTTLEGASTLTGRNGVAEMILSRRSGPGTSMQRPLWAESQ